MEHDGDQISFPSLILLLLHKITIGLNEAPD
jgi:hypothetical protein